MLNIAPHYKLEMAVIYTAICEGAILLQRKHVYFQILVVKQIYKLQVQKASVVTISLSKHVKSSAPSNIYSSLKKSYTRVCHTFYIFLHIELCSFDKKTTNWFQDNASPAKKTPWSKDFLWSWNVKEQYFIRYWTATAPNYPQGNMYQAMRVNVTNQFIMLSVYQGG